MNPDSRWLKISLFGLGLVTGSLALSQGISIWLIAAAYALAVSVIVGFDWVTLRPESTDALGSADRLDTDRVTGVATRRVVMQELERRTADSLLTESEIALLLVDIDDLASVNDRYGNWVGDRLLRHVSEACASSVRSSDTVGRFGEEEFALICPGSSVHGAELIANRVRSSIQGLDLSSFAFDEPLSVSIGVAGWSRDTGNMSDLLTSADVALSVARYRRKSRVPFQSH